MIQWTISGDNAIIMVFQYPKDDSVNWLQSIVNETTAQYGRKNVKLTPTSMMLAGRKYQGRQLIATLAKQKLQQEFFYVPTGNAAYILMIQDILTEQGAMTEETKHAKKLLMDSFRLVERRPSTL
jgi:hypothetical protein